MSLLKWRGVNRATKKVSKRGASKSTSLASAKTTRRCESLQSSRHLSD